MTRCVICGINWAEWCIACVKAHGVPAAQKERTMIGCGGDPEPVASFYKDPPFEFTNAEYAATKAIDESMKELNVPAQPDSYHTPALPTLDSSRLGCLRSIVEFEVAILEQMVGSTFSGADLNRQKIRILKAQLKVLKEEAKP